MQIRTIARAHLPIVALLILSLVLTACGSPQQSAGSASDPAPENTAAPRTEARGPVEPPVPAAADDTPIPTAPEPTEPVPAATAEDAAEPTARPENAPPPAREPDEDAAPAAAPRTRPARIEPAPRVAVQPAPKPRQPLAIPKPGPERKLQLTIDGYTTYVYASANGEERAVVAEEARWMPGMFEKYVTLSPDNRSLTWARTIRSKTDRMLMYAADVDGRNVRLLADLPWELWVARPAWSPDSRRIAYVRATSPGEKPGLELWVVDADGGNDRKLLSHPSFRAEIFYGTDPQPMRWTKYGDVQYKDYAAEKLWTVHGETGKLSSSTLTAKPPKVDIPVVKTKNPIPIQSQNDPRWRYDFMAPEPNSLGSFGCALTGVSMAFNAHGIPMEPRTLNKKMGDHSALFEWGYAEYVSDYKLNVSNQQWAFDWYALDLAMSRGWPTLVWLSDASTTDAALLTHWVLVVGGGGQTPDGYRIYDPWDGSTYKTLAYYTDKGYGLQRAYAYAPVTPKKKKKADDDKPAEKRTKRDDR